MWWIVIIAVVVLSVISLWIESRFWEKVAKEFLDYVWYARAFLVITVILNLLGVIDVF